MFRKTRQITGLVLAASSLGAGGLAIDKIRDNPRPEQPATEFEINPDGLTGLGGAAVRSTCDGLKEVLWYSNGGSDMVSLETIDAIRRQGGLESVITGIISSENKEKPDTELAAITEFAISASGCN
jgi:hypothetical protein